jgi:glycosyltransferase involved in cell wall biosynthesis
VRILVVSPYPPRRCGVGAYARDQVARLRAEGHDVKVLSPPDGDGDSTVPFAGGRAFLRASRLGGGFDRIIVHFQPGVYYRPRRPLSKVLTSAGLLWLVARRRQTELLVHEADRPVRWRPDYLLLGLALRRAPRVLFHTRAERDALEREYGVRVRAGFVPHRVAALAPGSREEARRALGLAAGGPVFVCVGFLHPSKGFDRALDAFSAAGQPDATLYIVGSVREPTAQNLAYASALARRCAAQPGATLVERYVDDREFDRWVAAADRVVLPYRRSWSSGVLARAHQLGTAAIVARAGGLAEQADGNDTVVDDDEGLIRAMVEAVAAHAAPS